MNSLNEEHEKSKVIDLYFQVWNNFVNTDVQFLMVSLLSDLKVQASHKCSRCQGQDECSKRMPKVYFIFVLYSNTHTCVLFQHL